jgi:hypothetical protein
MYITMANPTRLTLINLFATSRHSLLYISN